MFLHRQREPGRPGCLAGVDKKNAENEERSRQRKVEDEKRKKSASTSSTSHELSHQELDVSFSRTWIKNLDVRMATAKDIKTDFQDRVPYVITVH